MTLQTVTNILGGISKWPLPLTELVPVNYGEFFLHPDWHSILEVAEHLLPRTQIVIPTNGSKLTEDNVQLLSSIGTVKVVNFSINAFLASTYEQFCMLPASNLKRIEKAIILLRSLRSDIIIWASMVYDPMYQSEKEKELFIHHWLQYGVTPQIIPASNCARHRQIIKTTLPCRSIFSDLVIGYDYKLSSCCFDAGFVLDIGEYKGDVLKAWTNGKLNNLRRTHNAGDRQQYPLCAACSFA